MFIYLLWFIVVFYIYNTHAQKTPKSKGMLALMLAGLAIFVGLGDMLGGYDRYIYGEVFDSIADITIQKGNYLESNVFFLFEGEYGYLWLNVLISFVTHNRYIFILLYTLLIYILLYKSFSRFSENYGFTLLLFLGLWFFFTFTYLRQVLAATVAWLAVPYIIKRDWKRYFIVVILAYMFHHSAVIFFPMYFVPIMKFKEKYVLYVMVACFIIGVSGLSLGLYNTYGDVVESKKVDSYTSELYGFRVEYLAEVIVFLYLILSQYKRIPEDKEHLVLLNMALVFCAILLFFIKSGNSGRLSWYYMLGIISTLSFLYSRERKVNQSAGKIIVLMFLLYFRILYYWGIQLYPYKTFLTDGYRKGDVIHERYEYDDRYDADKFYR